MRTLLTLSLACMIGSIALPAVAQPLNPPAAAPKVESVTFTANGAVRRSARAQVSGEKVCYPPPPRRPLQDRERMARLPAARSLRVLQHRSEAVLSLLRPSWPSIERTAMATGRQAQWLPVVAPCRQSRAKPIRTYFRLARPGWRPSIGGKPPIDARSTLVSVPATRARTCRKSRCDPRARPHLASKRAQRRRAARNLLDNNWLLGQVAVGSDPLPGGYAWP
jgi:hypothetical protein